MGMIVGVFTGFHAAVEESFDGTALLLMRSTLELDGCVTNMVLLIEHLIHGLQDGRAFALRHVIDHDMAG